MHAYGDCNNNEINILFQDKDSVSGDVMSCIPLEIYQFFGRTYCLHLNKNINNTITILSWILEQ